MSGRKGIPKTAVKSLMEYCRIRSKEVGVPPAEMFKNYLELMKKYADYFFSEPWPEQPDEGFELSRRDREFVEGGKGHGEKVERFTVACLRRNISTEGFNSEGFAECLDYSGRLACGYCVVPEAAWLREQAERKQELRKQIEDEVKAGQPSEVVRGIYAHLNRPEAVREDRMLLVNLRFYEELGGAEGRTCGVKNRFRCPYGEESEQLVEDGDAATVVWRQIEWYNHHWNRSLSYSPPASSMKWYHYGEPSIIDVTSYDDILKAVEDGRLKRIMDEHEKYEKEQES